MGPVRVSSGYRSKLLGTWWLKTRFYSLMVMEAKCLKNQYHHIKSKVSPGPCSIQGWRKGAALCLSSLCWLWAFLGIWLPHSLALGYTSPSLCVLICACECVCVVFVKNLPNFLTDRVRIILRFYLRQSCHYSL